MLREQGLVKVVRDTFEDFERRSGCTKFLRTLNECDVKINEYKLRRIMRENGLFSIVVKKFKPHRLGKADGVFAENKLQRNFCQEEMY